MVKAKPHLAKVEPFKTVLSGDREAIAKLSLRDLEKIIAATFTGMSVDEFSAEAKKWIETAKDPRWKRTYTELTYQPMQEVLQYLRDNGYKTYIVTGGGQDFVRVYSEKAYDIPPEQVVGTAGRTTYSYEKNGKGFLTKDPKLLLNDNDAGKPEGIDFMIGQRPMLRSAIPRATARCSSTPQPVTARDLKCSSSTMTRRANTPMARRPDCQIRRSEHLPRPFTTRRRRTGGWLSA